MRRLARAGVVAFVMGSAGLAVGALTAYRDMAAAYLIAFVYAFSLIIGVLFFAMIGNAVGSRWFVALRRLVEGVTASLPALAALFVPLAVTVRVVYPWAAPGNTTALGPKHVYLNVPFFVARACVYFVVWLSIGEALRRASLAQDSADADGASRLSVTMRAVSSAGLPLASLAITFAAFDWVMSLEPRWYSTIFGVYFFAGAMLGATSLLAIIVYAARRAGALPAAISSSHVQAIGKLMLTFVVFWAYAAFCQLLLVWIADLPEEVVWYLRRIEGGWAAVCLALGVGYFALPFAALLSWRLKRRAGPLALVAGWLLIAHYVHVYWLLAPALGHAFTHAFWLDGAALLAVGGALTAFGAWRADGTSPVARNDPHFSLALSYEDT